jgi:hypothetical protein
MIVDVAGGRHRSVLTKEEKRKSILQRWSSLSDEEKFEFHSIMNEIDLLADDGGMGFDSVEEIFDSSRTYHDLVAGHYIDRVVSVEEFMLGKRYLGHVGKDLYPQWLADLKSLFRGGYASAIITGSLGCGKTVFCDMALAYMFYELCMLRDPQSTHGLMQGSEIVLVCFNRDKKLSRDVTFGGVKRKLEGSPFFKGLGIKFGTSEIVYPKKDIRIIAASVRSADALGRDVFGGIIDETDFLEGSALKGSGGLAKPGEKSFAELLYDSIMRRMVSRYDRAGVLPGKLLLSSSARHKQSFTNRLIGTSANDSTVFCRDYAIYDVKPASHFLPTRFWVLVGNERVRHKILSKAEYRNMGKRGRKALEDKGCKFLRVPENFRAVFESNIEDSIRDIAGVVTVTLSPFIQLRDRIYDSIDPTLSHPMPGETWRTNELPYIDWARITKMYDRRVGPGRLVQELRPRRHPDAQRFVHIDLSFGAQDAAGICIVHLAGMVDVERLTGEGDPILEQAPLIEVDLMLRILPPVDGEINFASVRGIVYDYMRHGFTFGFASLDGFQSGDSLQKFEGQGLKSGKISVDKNMEAYTYLKTAIYEGRLSFYKYPIVLGELEQLQRDDAAKKVIHVQGGTKDVADALAGASFAASTKVSIESSIMIGISEHGEDDKSAWIRETMHRSGDESVRKVGDVESEGKPIVFSG